MVWTDIGFAVAIPSLQRLINDNIIRSKQHIKDDFSFIYNYYQGVLMKFQATKDLTLTV